TVYLRPANAFVAGFIGAANLIDAVLLGRDGTVCELELALGAERMPARVRAAGGDGALNGRPVVLSVRPEDLALHLQRPDGAPAGDRADPIGTRRSGQFRLMRRAHHLGNPENTQRDERHDPAEVAKPLEHVDARLGRAFSAAKALLPSRAYRRQ